MSRVSASPTSASIGTTTTRPIQCSLINLILANTAKPKSLLNMNEFKAVVKSVIVSFFVLFTLIVYLHSTWQAPSGTLYEIIVPLHRVIDLDINPNSISRVTLLVTFLTILGAMQDASGETPQLYIIKGTLDGFMNVVFGAIYGVGAVFSALSIFVVQGSLTLGGSALDNLLNDRMRIELFSAGGFAVMAIGLNLLEIKKIRLGSLLPGLVITPVLVWLFAVPTGVIG